MPNPYHDENGKFCSKDQMLGAVLRLQQAGESDRATQLFLEYKTASEKPKNRTTEKTSEAIHSTGTIPSENKEGKPTALTEGMTPEEQARELSTFIQNSGLKEGAWRHAEKAESALARAWERSPKIGLASFSPDDTERAQLLYEFTDPNDTQKVLYAYRGGLFVDTLPLDDEWGESTRLDYRTCPASLEPVVLAPEQKQGFFPVSTDIAGKQARRWARGHTRTVKPKNAWAEKQIVVTGATEVDSRTEEVSYGNYQTVLIYRDDKTGELYQLTKLWDSWDTLENETSYSWAKVEAKTYTRNYAPQFVEGVGVMVDDEDSWM